MQTLPTLAYRSFTTVAARAAAEARRWLTMANDPRVIVVTGSYAPVITVTGKVNR
jgi:hypothetical protein